MNSRDQELKKLLRMEVAHKSPQSATTFAVLAIFIFFYCFNCKEYSLLIKFSSLMIVGFSISRLFISKKVKEMKSMTTKQWKMIVVLIWLNAIFWSVIFNLASLELKLTSIHFIVTTTMLTGFIAASIVTLSYDPILFIPFQFILLIPQLGVIVYLHYGPEKINGLVMIIPYSLYLIYQLLQFKDFRHQLIQRFGYQLDLESSNMELQKSQKALIDQTMKLVHTSRLAALGEMSAGIAHEVNNPLAIISGSMQQIEKSVTRGEVDKDYILKLTGKSQHSIERVTKIIKGLKHFSQQSDALPKVSTTLKEIIDDTVNFCSEMLQGRYIELRIGNIPDIKIECHPVQISQVLINLIKNAEDALIQAKTVDKDRWISIDFKLHPSHIHLNVMNGGPTIPESIQAKLFQPFFTTKIVGQGTGLGLSISHGIMKEHRGDLVFLSESAHTTFTLILPLD